MNIYWSTKAKAQLHESAVWMFKNHFPKVTVENLRKIEKEVNNKLQYMPGRFKYDHNINAHKLLIKPYTIGFNIVDDNNIIITQFTPQKLIH